MICLKQMCIVGNPKAEDSTKRIEDHAMVGESQSSQAETFKKLLEDNITVHMIKSNNKYRKRQIEQKINDSLYHLQHMGDIQMLGLKNKLFDWTPVNIQEYYPCTTLDSIQSQTLGRRFVDGSRACSTCLEILKNRRYTFR